MSTGDRPPDPMNTHIVPPTATLVIDVIRSAGRVVAGVNREHEFGLFAESVVRLLYFFRCFYKVSIINKIKWWRRRESN